jgi:hypothetical protein
MPKAYVYFSQAKFDEICELLENGVNLRAISRMDGMPTAHNIVRWSKQTPELQAQYALAREHGYSLMADDLIDIADNDISEQVRYRVDARKWLMSKVLPKTFGDKQQVESKVTVDWAQVTQEAMDKWRKEEEADRVATIDGRLSL